MKYFLSFTLPGLPKRTNNRPQHWAVRHKETKKWKDMVGYSVLQHGKPTYPLSSAALTLTRLSSVSPDFDGLVSSFKHIIDGLVEAGVLEDDAYDVIGAPTYVWQKAPPRKGSIKVVVCEV